MAGGNLSPRQRMINLMYLVFISMLALNMGKEVLNAFGLVNEKFEKSNDRANASNILAFEALQKNADENAQQYGEVFQKAKEIKALSDDFYNSLAKIKDGLETEIGQKNLPADQKDYQAMDKSDYLDDLFFEGEGYKKGGKEFMEQITNYRDKMLSILGDNPKYADLVEKIKSTFNTDKVKAKDGTMQDWLFYNFDGYPYIASLSKFSMMQSDIRSIEQESYGIMLEGNLKAQISMTNYTTLLEQGKGAYYQGETFDGSIVLGRKDASTKPNEVELSLDGRRLSASEYEILDGQVKLKVGAGNAGEHKITGNLHFDQDGKRISVPVDKAFTVIPKPNSAVISADKMNVVYRGVSNPITISMPGVSDNKVNASAPGLSKTSGSKYILKPGNGREVTINVTGEVDGTKFSSSQQFRIKDIPAASASVLKQTGKIAIPKANLAMATIEAVLEDFDFDLTLRVKSFKISIPGQPSISVSGNKLNDAAKSALSRAKKGDMVQIFDLAVEDASNPAYLHKKPSNIIVEITN